jgi:hypothetical protein
MGIEVEKSLPHEQQQNGRAERFNRTIWDKAQSLRFDACLPNSWWEFCVEHALYLYNRTPLKRANWSTPYELIKGEKPDLSNLKVFGCAAYVFLPPEVRKNKLSPKSELMIFLGFKPGMKGFRFMRLPNNIIFMGATAIFDENLFPKCEKPSIPDVTTIPEALPDNVSVHDPSEDPPSNSNIPSEDNDNPYFLPMEFNSHKRTSADHHKLPNPSLNPSNDDSESNLPSDPLLRQRPAVRVRGQPSQPPTVLPR